MASFTEGVEVLAVLGISTLVKHLIYVQWRNRKPPDAERVAQVTDLRLYPLKSGRGIGVKEIHCDWDTGPHLGDITDR